MADRAKLADFVRSATPSLLRTLRRLGVAACDLDDAAADTFRAVIERWADYDSDRPIAPWVFGFARNVARSYRRKRRRFLREDGGDSTDDVCGSSGTAEDKYLRRRLALALDELPDEQREVIVAMDIEDMSARELAEVTGVSENTIYDRLRRARAKLRVALTAPDPLREEAS